MRIVAIYIEEHEYLFDKPQTINFGGKYFYKFKLKGEEIIISRTLNENYISGFFDLTGLSSKLTNISAIVGQNGAGKSTLLDIIRSEFIENKNALPRSRVLFLAELDNAEKPIIIRNNFNKVLLEITIPKVKLIELKEVTKKSIRTIYYSPHYDYKLNQNFDNVDNFDISFDKILEKDLSELNEKDSNENGWPYSPSQELLFKNSIRQILFMNSKLVTDQKIFQDLFHLQGHNESILHFRGYKAEERVKNTPYQLREILQLVNRKVEDELNNLKESNQVNINKYLLKRNILNILLGLITRQFEGRNNFLQNGEFPYEKLRAKLKNLDAKDTFLLLIQYSALKFENNEYKIFDIKTVKTLLHKLYEAIDKVVDERSVTSHTLMASKDDTLEILTLQKQFLNDLSNYYRRFYSKNDDSINFERDKIEEFINYMPFSKRLSSGENALLNLFSRIYDFLNSNTKVNNYKNYILLLDEGDMTFHPSWKKRYVKSLLKTLPYFFDELKHKPSLQIIFTTHDPLTLSDLPNSNVTYIERRDYESLSNILDYDNINRPVKTFGANISDLIADSFFIENSLIGDFAFDKIHESIDWLNDKDNKQKAEYYRKLINLVDEPIVQRKLAEMYDEKMESNFQLSVVDEQIRKLEELKKKLEK